MFLAQLVRKCKNEVTFFFLSSKHDIKSDIHIFQTQTQCSCPKIGSSFELISPFQVNHLLRNATKLKFKLKFKQSQEKRPKLIVFFFFL